MPRKAAVTHYQSAPAWGPISRAILLSSSLLLTASVCVSVPEDVFWKATLLLVHACKLELACPRSSLEQGVGMDTLDFLTLKRHNCVLHFLLEFVHTMGFLVL